MARARGPNRPAPSIRWISSPVTPAGRSARRKMQLMRSAIRYWSWYSENTAKSRRATGSQHRERVTTCVAAGSSHAA